MFNFAVDFKKLASDMLAPDHRKTKLIDWLTVLISGIKHIHTQFKAYVDEKRFDLMFTSQVIYLEYLLNFKFNGGLNTILVQDASNAERSYIYQASEEIPLYIVTADEFDPEIDLYIYNIAEFANPVDFVIWVPVSLFFNKTEMTALVKRYNQAGKSFTIKTY